MRTTVSISDELLEAAKRQAFERGKTLGQVIETALRRHLAVDRYAAAPLESANHSRWPAAARNAMRDRATARARRALDSTV